jgi:hypothetical protein
MDIKIFTLSFDTGASGDHVHMEMYSGHAEDFAGVNLAQLDTWVFNKVTVRLIAEVTQPRGYIGYVRYISCKRWVFLVEGKYS